MKALLTALVLVTTSSFAMAEESELNKTCLAKVKAVSTAMAKANLLEGAKLKSLIVNSKVDDSGGDFEPTKITADFVVTKDGKSGQGQVLTEALVTDGDCIVFSATMSKM